MLNVDIIFGKNLYLNVFIPLHPIPGLRVDGHKLYCFVCKHLLSSSLYNVNNVCHKFLNAGLLCLINCPKRRSFSLTSASGVFVYQALCSRFVLELIMKPLVSSICVDVSFGNCP